MVEYSYSVFFDPETINHDVTLDVEVLEVTEVGSGEVTSAVIRLNAQLGKYLTNVPWAGDPPTQYERFKVTITDEDSNVLTRVYEINRIIPIQNHEEGTSVEFECLGLEHHLQKIQFAKQFRFENAFDVAKDIGDFYNSNRVAASTQPLLVKHDDVSTGSGTGFNDLPKWNSNFYPFGNKSLPCYDALAELVDSGGAPVTTGGLGDFWELFFKRGATDNEIEFHAFSSGSTGTSVTIDNALDVNVAENEGGIENFTGNLIKVEGSENGSLPPDFAKFAGKQEIFFQFPDWIDPATSDQNYPADARVLFGGLIYKSDIANNSSTPPTNWTAESFETFVGTSTEYSPWTNNKAAHTKNSGSNPVPATYGTVENFNQSGMWDSNLVVNDEVNWQFPVNQRIRQTTDIDVNYLYNQATAGTHRGMWYLVDSNIGALGVPFTQNSGNDRFGNAYSDKFVRRNFSEFTGADEYKNWDVIGPLDSAGKVRALVSGDLCAVLDENKMYKYSGAIWEDKSADARLNHCFHNYTALTTSDGFNNIAKTAGNYFDSSAIKISYQYDPVALQDLVASFLTSNEFYQAGAWYCMRFPYPYTTQNSVPTKGVLWGNNATKKGPVTIDTKNMHFTHSFNVGFNNSEAEDFGPINSVNFFIKHEWFVHMVDFESPHTNEVDKTIWFDAGDFKYRCSLYDTAGNVVVNDFTVPFNNVWEPISLAITDFKAYRARTNIGLGNIRSTLIPLGIEVLNRFDWENISMISIQWQEPYDSEGRYAPAGTRVQKSPLAQMAIEFIAIPADLGWIAQPLAEYAGVNLYIDGFHFGKTMLSVTDPITTGRVIEPPTEHFQWIDNQYQLEQAAEAMLQIHQFRQNKWIVATEGRLDVGFGDFFFLEDDQLVNRADRNATPPDGNDGDPNTVKLVAKRITHRIDKPAQGVGGYITTIEAAKRYEGTPDN
jgi:hypothetical protein